MMKPVRLALLAGSPVYYQAPLYRRLAQDPRIDFTAFFASDQGARRLVSNDFHAPVDWGVDAVSGYRSVFLKKADSNPTNGSILALRDRDVVGHLRDGRFDALWLHGYHTLTHVLAALTQKRLGGAVLYREDQTLLSPRPLWKSSVKDIALRWLFDGSYGLFVGTENRRWFKRWGIPDERLFHVPYAVDNDALRHAARVLTPCREALKQTFGLRTDAPVIVSVGRLVTKKQPLHLLRAFQRVRMQQPCSLLIVGTGPLELEMQRVVSEEEIPDVVFAGFLDQTEVASAYACGDVFALVSSHDETWGMVVNEAMNFGLPIVISDQVGCGSDLIHHGENGFVVPHHDGPALIGALGRLVASSELRTALGEASLSAISLRTYDATVTGMTTALRAAVGEERWALAERAARRMAAA